MTTTDAEIREILATTKVIAVVGWSPKPDRPSHRVAAFLAARGYRVIPVNPGAAGQVALGEVVRASLEGMSEPVDMVDIFRRSADVLPVVDAALAHLPGCARCGCSLGWKTPKRRRWRRHAGCRWCRTAARQSRFHG